MKTLAVIPSEPIAEYLDAGYGADWLMDYYNPSHYFDKVYLLSPLEEDESDFLGMEVIKTLDKELPKRLKELNVDVVRAYGGYWACDMACNYKVKGIPVVVSVHDINPNLLHDSIKKADIVLCVSSIVKEKVLEKFPNESHVWILPNRVNFKTMHPYTPEECEDLMMQFPFTHKILHVGRKTKQKNLDTLIKALKILGDEYCLISSGKGDVEEYHKLADEQDVRERCLFFEAIPQEELARYYSFADCMCTPSRWEGFGMVFTEALACGAVVITSDIAPMNDFITHNENGLLIEDYENPQKLAEVIKHACTDDGIRKILKTNARNSVTKFSKERIDTMEAGYYRQIEVMKKNKEFDHVWYKKLFG
ncbi:hypothetical protein MNBD_GAMMA03-2077 [hydrothermal vent metagenome]|uniref:Glycosyl transferase family 1 domain-containing protein n=1 Tax=hydrothermal vent metagenome TaxID=652676 RepID=A0A3B0W7D4_9ZZZZ